MKRFISLLLVSLAIVVCGALQSVAEEDPRTIMSSGVTQAKANDVAGIGSATNSTIAVEEKEGRVYITITNPLITPKGDTKGKGLKPAVRIKLASGILDAAGKKPYFAVVQVNDGQARFDLPNFAKSVNEPVVEHIWGYGEAADGTVGYLVLDPKDEWVCYKEKTMGGPDLETLAIGLVMYPDKPVVSLKSIGKGKLVQGRHPNLK